MRTSGHLKVICGSLFGDLNHIKLGHHTTQACISQGNSQSYSGTEAGRPNAAPETSGYQPINTSQPGGRQGPTYSSESPSARWSSSSPSASWGNSQAIGDQGDSANQSQDGTGASLLQKVKEYLPGSGQAQAQDTGYSGAGPRTQQDELPVVPVVSRQSFMLEIMQRLAYARGCTSLTK